MSILTNVVNFAIVVSVLCDCLVSQETVNVESTIKNSELPIVVQIVNHSSLLLRNSISHSAEQDSVDGKNRKSGFGHAWLPKASFFTQHSSLIPRRGQNIQPSDPGENVTGQTWGSWSMKEVDPDHRRGKRSNAVQHLHDISSAFTPIEGYYYFNPQFPLPAKHRDFHPSGILTPSSSLNNILHYQSQSESTSLADFNKFLFHAENNEHSRTPLGYFPPFNADKNQFILTQSPTTPPNHNGCCNNHHSPHNNAYLSLQSLPLPPNVEGYYVPQPPSSVPTNKGYQGPQHPSPTRNFKDIFDPQPPTLRPNEKEYYGYQSPFPLPNIKDHFGPQQHSAPNIKKNGGTQPSSPPQNIKEYYGPQPPSPPPSIGGNCCTQPPSPPPHIKEYYGPQPPSPPPHIKEYYGPQPPSPPPNIKEYYVPQPPSPPPNIKEYYSPQPPSPPPHIKEYYGLQPPSPPPINRETFCPQPPSPPPNFKEHYGPQPLSPPPRSNGYYDLKYLPFAQISNDYNGLRSPCSQRNNEAYFSLEPSAALCSDKGYYDHQFVSFPSSKDQHEPNPPFAPHKGPYRSLPPFRVLDDYEFYTTKHQFAPLPTENNPPSFEDNKKLPVSLRSPLVEVSVIPSLSFTLQDVTRVDSPNVVLVDPLTLAQNGSHGSGAVINRRSQDRHS